MRWERVRSCRAVLQGYRGPAWVLVGDEPLIRPEPLADLLARQRAEGAACLVSRTALGHDRLGDLRTDAVPDA